MTKTTSPKNSADIKATVENTIKTAQENVQKTVQSAQENVQKAVKEATTNMDNVTEFSKANFDAIVASSNVAAKIAQTFSADFIETSKKAVEKNMTDAKALFSAKTPAEFFELQANIFKNRYDELVSESTRINEITSNKASEVIQPLKARYEEVATKYNFPTAL
ncbi:MAG: phasin family protein [Emcibacter sp.]|nr:phasin family protein [Emcibacter sp.]